MLGTPLATLPSKQGLKRRPTAWHWSSGSPLATLPSKQGLKPPRKREVALGEYPSRYTSIKTRIETTNRGGHHAKSGLPLATLPSKQGLKRSRRYPLERATGRLSLHFHQNKD